MNCTKYLVKEMKFCKKEIEFCTFFSFFSNFLYYMLCLPELSHLCFTGPAYLYHPSFEPVLISFY